MNVHYNREYIDLNNLDEIPILQRMNTLKGLFKK